MQETINQRIARLRRALGYTQGDMAEMLDMKQSTYAKRELKGKFDGDLIVKISDLLEVDTNTILFGTNTPHQQPPSKPVEPENKGVVLSGIEEGILTALRNISNQKRRALYKLILIVLENRSLDIIGEVSRIEATVKKADTEKNYEQRRCKIQ